ncbi:TetR/AcrR family transcriptional regulator [Phytomonospora endophytica]|uniref:AcrR family transcriptional regulator n=1 Tax=Phytomonospora endophytica TaxID=714109 RepID=A0A841FQ36_9ACTN|nr:TetR family transcriptional regulator [Phytomonospora endophytica]MBB6035908.1 AcrR family transcriptional regulator [Phytomonospora endophytica]GIG71095.1 TetR family transcriptional regulator [Phytomonospora endophytica]
MTATEETPVRRRRSDATKAAILDAARERFIAEGYEGATIRGIAADAHIDPAMVMRYFGSKEKLFALAASYDLHLPDFTTLPRERLGESIMRHLLNLWESDRTLVALLRTAVSNEEAAAERVREIWSGQVLTGLGKLFGDDRELAARRAGLVVTQLLGVVLCRYVLRLPPVVDLEPEEIVAWVGPTVQRYLTAGEP